jgi:hypothetical protein
MKSRPDPAPGTDFAAGSTFVYITVADLLAFVRRGFLLALVLSLAAGSGAWLLGSRRAPEYSATAFLLSVRPESAPAWPGVMPPPALDPAIYGAAVHEGPILDQLLADPLVQATGWTRDELRGRIRVLSDASLQSTVVRVEVTAAEPGTAAGLADRVAHELISWDTGRSARLLADWQESLSRAVATTRAALQGVGTADAGLEILEARYTQRLDELIVAASYVPVGQLMLLADARLPAEPSNANVPVAVVLAVILALLAAYLLQFIADLHRQQALRVRAGT